MTLKLTQKERSALLAGEFPRIIRKHEGKCPFEVGEEIVLRSQKTINGPIPQVSIEITGKHRKSVRSWEVIYCAKDNRGLYLGKQGYTRSGAESIDPEAPVLDPDAQKRYAAQGRLARAERKERDDEARKAQGRAARARLTETLSGLTPEAHLAFLAKFNRMCEQAKETK